MQNTIKAAAENTLKIANVKAVVTVTPSTISLDEISNIEDANKIEAAFVKAGMKSLGICDMEEIGMGIGFCLTISY